MKFLYDIMKLKHPRMRCSRCGRRRRRKANKEIRRILRREFLAEAEGLDDHELLFAFHDQEGLERVGSALAASDIDSGCKYISSWTSVVGDVLDVPLPLLKKRKQHLRALRQFVSGSSHAGEISIRALIRNPRLLKREPLVRGGPIYPFMAVLLSCLMMFHGPSRPEFKISHIELRAHLVIVRVGTRKNNQAGHLPKNWRMLELGCCC